MKTSEPKSRKKNSASDEGDDTLIAAIARLSRLMRRHPKDSSEPRDSAEHRLLRLLAEHDGARAMELAAKADIRPASATDALNRLEKRCLIVRKQDTEDFRAKRIFLTEKAQERIRIRLKGKRERNSQMLSCLTKKEAADFLFICGKLCTFLESATEKK